MRDFQRGETVEIYAEVTDQDGDYTDPSTSITATITDPDDTEQETTQALTKLATGKYYYQYDLDAAAALGWWRALVIVTDGGTVTKERISFKVVA